MEFKRILAVISALAVLGCASGCSKDEESPEADSSTTTTSTSTTADTTTHKIWSTAAIENTTTTTTKKVTTTKKTNAATAAQNQNSASGDYAYSYAGFNPVVTDMSVPFNTILLNRYYRLPDGYVPNLTPAVLGSDVKLDYRVSPYYQEMYTAALLDGIILTPVSGYRSFERQKNNFENRIRTYESQGMNKVDATVKASEIILLPGTSEHNAGLAMDICSLSVSFENTNEFRWLQAHAHEYGFIMRYPKDKTHITKITYEPWHYRYVGVEIATHLKQTGQVLEEYLGKMN